MRGSGGRQRGSRRREETGLAPTPPSPRGAMGDPRLSRTPAPVPAFFHRAQEPSFSLKRRGGGAEAALARSPTPRPPHKSWQPVSRLFPGRERSWSQPRPRSVSALGPLSRDGYDESKGEPYFEQCFQRICRLGHGSFGDVFKVRSKADGRLYAIKRSRQRFRGARDRRRRLGEARRHEGLGPHPNLLGFVRAWEERGQLYIQTELCSGTLERLAQVGHPAGGPLPEPRVWDVLCDLLSALGHLHRRQLAHLDVKPANVFLGPGGVCKLGDFGLALEVEGDGGGRPADAQEGDPKYMAPELLDGVYGTAADIFSLGISILEISSNLELPRSGEAWQKLRQGYLPPEFVSGLSPELQGVLRAMLQPDCRCRASAEELLSLPVLRRARQWRRLHLLLDSGLGRALGVCRFLLSLLCSLWTAFSGPLLQLLVRRPCPPPVSPPPSALHDSSLYSDLDDSSFRDEVFERHHRTVPPKALFPPHSELDDPTEFSFLSGSVTKPSLGSTSTPRNLSTERSSIRRSSFRASPDLSRIGGVSPLPGELSAPEEEEDGVALPSGQAAFEPRNLLSLFDESVACD